MVAFSLPRDGIRQFPQLFRIVCVPEPREYLILIFWLLDQLGSIDSARIISGRLHGCIVINSLRELLSIGKVPVAEHVHNDVTPHESTDLPAFQDANQPFEVLIHVIYGQVLAVLFLSRGVRSREPRFDWR